MATSITMPKLGLTMTEGTISKWLKKEGDSVAAGDSLFVVSTDKLTYEYRAEVSGTLLKIVVPEEGTVAVGGEVGIVGETDESVEAVPAAKVVSVEISKASGTGPVAAAPLLKESSVNASPKARSFAKARGIDLSLIAGHGEPPMVHLADARAYADARIVNATPKARSLARERKVDLSAVAGHGEPPMIHVADVEAWLATNKVKSSPLAAKMAAELGVDMAGLGLDRRVMSGDVMKAAGIVPATSAAEAPGAVKTCENEADVKPMTKMRQIISERMTESVTAIPAVNYQTDVDCTALKAMRNALKNDGAKVSFNDIIMKACARVLMEMPMCNCSTDMERKCYVMHGFVNIGLAVAVDGGLVVPNVKHVQTKGLAEISGESAALVEKARSGSLMPDDMSGGTFTISSLGMFGIKHFTPIINPPESCILGVTMIEERAVVRDGQIAIRPMSTFCLTADHRSVDGAGAAKFLQRLKELLENPYLMLL